MSYEKPVKACQDAPVGFRTVNTLSGNQDDTKAALEVEHTPQPEQPPFAPGFGNVSGSGSQLDGGARIDVLNGGQHDTPKVARGTLRLEIDELFSVGGNPLRIASRSGVCVDFVRIGVGSYFIPISGLSDFDVSAWPLYDGAQMRLVEQTPSTGAPSPGVFISLWQAATLESSNVGFRLTDFDFQLVVYGYTDEQAAEGAATPARRFTRRRGPLRFWPGGRSRR